jgi:hypothetical protein
MIDPDELDAIRARYVPGRRVRFLGFGEPDRSALRPGTLGTVRRVDDLGTVHVDWDDGTRLGCVVAPPDGEREDRIELLNP